MVRAYRRDAHDWRVPHFRHTGVTSPFRARKRPPQPSQRLLTGSFLLRLLIVRSAHANARTITTAVMRTDVVVPPLEAIKA